MRAVGVVSEYNPFHLGHAWHLAETRRLLGEEVAVVCAMSGNFVQRGECALADKWSRARCALLGGADLVVEIPFLWAVSSAERFARGALEVLGNTGVVGTLSFGCETDRPEELAAAAACLDREEVAQRLWARVRQGEFVASARQRTVREFIGPAAECLSTPNNNLAVEYLRAIRRLGLDMETLAIPRRGAGHDDLRAHGGFASGERIRTLLQEGKWGEAERSLPPATLEILREEWEEGRAPARLKNCQRAILARLRTMEPEDFAPFPDSGLEEGLPHRLLTAARQACSLEELLEMCKTRRYAYARLRRLVLRAYVGAGGPEEGERVPYIRVLGMNDRGKALLGEMRDSGVENVVVKPAHGRRLAGERAREIFRWESLSTDLYGLCTPQILPCGLEWSTGPVILEGGAGEQGGAR